MAAALLALPQMALAQETTGTINLTGTVAGQCSITGGGQSFGETINLGELSGNDGRLRTDLTDAAADAVRNFSVVCNTATPRVRLSATRLSTAGTAPAGYSGNIDFTAAVAVLQASGTPPQITYTTASSLPPPTTPQRPATTPVILTVPVVCWADAILGMASRTAASARYLMCPPSASGGGADGDREAIRVGIGGDQERRLRIAGAADAQERSRRVLRWAGKAQASGRSGRAPENASVGAGSERRRLASLQRGGSGDARQPERDLIGR